jgi:hypothetical protein
MAVLTAAGLLYVGQASRLHEHAYNLDRLQARKFELQQLRASRLRSLAELTHPAELERRAVAAGFDFPSERRTIASDEIERLAALEVMQIGQHGPLSALAGRPVHEMVTPPQSTALGLRVTGVPVAASISP